MTTVVNGVDESAKLAEVDAAKQKANEQFKLGHYDKAQILYTDAISCAEGLAGDEAKPPALTKQLSILYANRSIAFLRSELYGYALDDADRSIQLDNNYTKAYYRRAAANMALGRFKKALRDFELVHKAHPKDVDAKKKFDECKKIYMQEAFAKAIAIEEKSIADQIDIASMTIEDSYEGPSLAPDGAVTEQFMRELMEWYKKQKVLHKKYAFAMIMAARKYFMQQPTLVDIAVPKGGKFTICGDIHGQFYDLMNIFELNGLPSPDNPYLFNGDFVDRGSFSVEVIFTLLGYKLLYPNHFFMSRGNHESHVMNQMYGFEGELKAKYNQQMADIFTETFNYLPLAHLVDGKVFVTHGGLFKDDGVTLDDIRKEHRVRQPPDSGIMTDLLWSDPQELNGRSPSKRGVGIQFGPDVTEAFLSKNNLEYVVRSHEVKNEGYEVAHGGKCITVFSAPNYCDTFGNKGAFITLKGGDRKPNFVAFDAVEHPKVRPMAYANSLFSMMAGM